MTEKKNDGGAAFPAWADHYGIQAGMSLRDWFAGQALSASYQHMLTIYSRIGSAAMGAAVRDAYEIADAMLLEREK